MAKNGGHVRPGNTVVFTEILDFLKQIIILIWDILLLQVIYRFRLGQVECTS